MAGTFDPITLEILWGRLVAGVDEAAATMARTAFSTILRESNDYSVVLLDIEGNSLAQSTQSIPTFMGTIPITVKHFLKHHPAPSLRQGDVVISNDPWLTSGHLPDVTLMAPIFAGERLVALCATCGHLPDVGGTVRNASLREVFQEGIRIPVCKLMDGGEPNREVFRFLEANVRVPEQVVGDLHAHIAASESAARRLLDLMREYGLGDIVELAATIQHVSEQAMRQAVRGIPSGEYRAAVTVDGIVADLTIAACITVDCDSIHVDYSGTSEQVDAAVNVTLPFTFAQTAYPLKCLLSPTIPNNEGSFRPITMTAPEGSVLNARFPAAVGARHLVGHLLPQAVFTALAPALPEQVQAASFSPQWCAITSGVRPDGGRYSHYFFCSGGQGASATQDGWPCLSFPGNVATAPVEVTESVAPLLVERKEIRADSGGAGRRRGGCGQNIVYRLLGNAPATLSLIAGRLRYAAPGLFGGGAGATGAVAINGEAIDPRDQKVLRPGDRVVLSLPGGGGYGAPDERDPADVAADLAHGLVRAARVADSGGGVSSRAQGRGGQPQVAAD